MKRIFISVASFVDSELEKTLLSAFSQAKYKGRLVFGVLNQTPTAKVDRTMLTRHGLPLRLLQVTPEESQGAAWARAVVQTLFDGEDYYLQIDSHMLFTPDWDVRLVQDMETVGDEKAILSAYPYGYHYQDGQPVLDCEVSPDTTLVLRPKSDLEWPAILFESRHYAGKAYVSGCHLAAGFLFTAGRFVEEVPYDSRYYFHGEEHGLFLRAYTRGWTVYHPPFIPVYHLYKKSGVSQIGHHWNPRWKRKPDDIARLQERARERLDDLIAGRLSGVWGLGQERTLEDLARDFGVDYRNRVVEEPAYLFGALL